MFKNSCQVGKFVVASICTITEPEEQHIYEYKEPNQKAYLAICSDPNNVIIDNT